MSNRIYDQETQAHLLSLSAVCKVSAKQIQYTQEFRKNAVFQSKSGKLAKQIFIDAGFDISIFAVDYCKKMIKQWKRECRIRGDDGFILRPKGRPKKIASDELSYEEQKFMIAYLEEENRLLKKLKALGHL